MRTVLLVEDNEKLNEINRRALENDGCEVLTALTLERAREHLKSNAPDVILLDIVLPDGDGIDFCGEIRASTDAHILFLTSKLEHEDRIRGLETGGDDYITKPYKLDEMLSRVRAALRRRGMDAAKPPARMLICGALSLDILSGQAHVNGIDMMLNVKEFAVLRLLVENRGKTLAKETIYESVWNRPMAGDANALKMAISRVRKKLEENSDFSITVIRGEGYQFD